MRAAAAAIAYAGELDFSAPWRRVGFVEAIAEATGIDLRGGARRRVAAGGGRRAQGWRSATEGASWAQIADELLSKFVEPTLQRADFVLDYPVELSPFAREHRSRAGLVERWEAFAGGMEIANAFSELNDADVQRERFEAQQAPPRAATRRRSPTTSCSCRRSSRACRRPAASGLGHRPAGDAADRARLDPRGRAVPGDARLSGVPCAMARAALQASSCGAQLTIDPHGARGPVGRLPVRRRSKRTT